MEELTPALRGEIMTRVPLLQRGLLSSVSHAWREASSPLHGSWRHLFFSSEETEELSDTMLEALARHLKKLRRQGALGPVALDLRNARCITERGIVALFPQGFAQKRPRPLEELSIIRLTGPAFFIIVHLADIHVFLQDAIEFLMKRSSASKRVILRTL